MKLPPGEFYFHSLYPARNIKKTCKLVPSWHIPFEAFDDKIKTFFFISNKISRRHDTSIDGCGSCEKESHANKSLLKFMVQEVIHFRMLCGGVEAVANLVLHWFIRL